MQINNTRVRLQAYIMLTWIYILWIKHSPAPSGFLTRNYTTGKKIGAFRKMEMKLTRHRASHLKCLIWWYSVLHNAVPPWPLSSFKMFSSPQKNTQYPLSNHSPSSLPQPPATSNLLSVSMDLSVLDIPYKRSRNGLLSYINHLKYYVVTLNVNKVKSGMCALRWPSGGRISQTGTVSQGLPPLLTNRIITKILHSTVIIMKQNTKC